MTDDQSRPVATSPDDYTLTIDDAAIRYEHAGHPRTQRTIQRYCAKGHLECLRKETPFGEKYLITATSVARHIAQIEELATATSRDASRHAAASVARPESHDEGNREGSTSPDQPRQVATEDRYVRLLESDNEFLRAQVAVKDTQIAEMQERAHETNALINGLQRMLSPLLGSPERADPSTANDPGEV